MRREDREKIHWADDAAKRIIKVKGDKEIYTLAAGITPSGIVHIGNFRELITVELVKRALEKRGKKVRFIFSWDDYDVFRKVPANLPPDKRAIFPKWLGKSISAIPDPFTEEKSYAAYFEKKLENSLEKVKVCPEFLYQSEKSQQGGSSKK